MKEVGVSVGLGECNDGEEFGKIEEPGIPEDSLAVQAVTPRSNAPTEIEIQSFIQGPFKRARPVEMDW
jgi:hypothetical protein